MTYIVCESQPSLSRSRVEVARFNSRAEAQAWIDETYAEDDFLEWLTPWIEID